jgi:hypothetical protein
MASSLRLWLMKCQMSNMKIEAPIASTTNTAESEAAAGPTTFQDTVEGVLFLITIIMKVVVVSLYFPQ